MLKNEIRDVSPSWIPCQGETDAETMQLVQIAFVLIEKLQSCFEALEPESKVNSNFDYQFWTYTDLKLNALPKCYLLNIWWQFQSYHGTFYSLMSAKYVHYFRAWEFLRKAGFEFISHNYLSRVVPSGRELSLLLLPYVVKINSPKEFEICASWYQVTTCDTRDVDK